MLGDVAADAERAYDVRKNAVIGVGPETTSAKGSCWRWQHRNISSPTPACWPEACWHGRRTLSFATRRPSCCHSRSKRTANHWRRSMNWQRCPATPTTASNSFRGVGTCANCHIVNKFGKDVGPDLSEIGSKLSREAMYTSILDPSAGISHNYENYIVVTASGQVINGLKMSETPDEVVIRTPRGDRSQDPARRHRTD